MAVKEILSEHERKMQKALDILHDELRTVRTARASTGLVENIKADFYGVPTPLKQMAALAAPQPDMIIIKPFDPTSLKEIEKAIKNSDLSIAPMIEGKFIRLSIPSLSAERRKQIVQQVKSLGEQTKVGIRNVRRDAIKKLESRQKEKVITEDDQEKGKKNVEDMTKKYTDEVDSVIKAKSDEIMAT